MQIEPNRSEGLTADDVQAEMDKILAPGYFTNLDRFVSCLRKDEKFVPYGKMIHSFTIETSKWKQLCVM